MAALPGNALGPDAPNSASPLKVDGEVSLVGWFTTITNFIKAMSPASGGVYDTGWMPLTLDSGFTGGSPVIRRIGRHVRIRGATVSGELPTGGTIIGSAAIPSGLRPSGSERGGCYLTGNHVGVIGVDVSGNISVFHQSSAGTRTTLQFALGWFI
ncbi:hypothetical protein AFL94_08740 [Arthrobacter sp. LS16]|nr:hypothetical protein AFL94_08740 [Arthrobacter sp. LS16]